MRKQWTVDEVGVCLYRLKEINGAVVSLKCKYFDVPPRAHHIHIIYTPYFIIRRVGCNSILHWCLYIPPTLYKYIVYGINNYTI